MNNFSKILKIGTRGSPLALAQARDVQAKLVAVHPDLETELVVIKTSGDWNPADGDVRLSASEGGKGQFAKEIEQALLAGGIDAAVHSMKDMDSQLPDGLVIEHVLEREDPRDALLFNSKISKLADNIQLGDGVFDVLPQGCVVGTASVRRAAFLLSKRSDLEIVPFRGNVQTRIDRLRGGASEGPENTEGEIGCTLLAMAGMNRLGIADEADIILEPEEMLPAAGQGAVGVELRAGDEEALSVFGRISHLDTVLCVKAEREVLRVLDGSCHTPVGAYAVFQEGEIRLRVCVVSLDGRQRFEDEICRSAGTVNEALELGYEIGQRLKKRIPPGILSDG